MSEEDFSKALRGYLRLHGLHVVVTAPTSDHTGVSDLIVSSRRTQTVLAWAELKVDGEKLRPSQVEFLRAADRDGGNAYVLRYHSATGLVTVERPKAVDGWAVDGCKLIPVFGTARWSSGFDWEAAFVQWRRKRGRASQVNQL